MTLYTDVEPMRILIASARKIENIALWLSKECRTKIHFFLHFVLSPLPAFSSARQADSFSVGPNESWDILELKMRGIRIQ
jgi:hypothetical protein